MLNMQRLANRRRDVGLVFAPIDDEDSTDPIIIAIRYLRTEKTMWQQGRQVVRSGITMPLEALCSRLERRGFNRPTLLSERRLFLRDKAGDLFQLLNADVETTGSEVFFETRLAREEWRSGRGAQYIDSTETLRLVDHTGRPYLAATYPYAVDYSGRRYTDPSGQPYYLIRG